MDIQQLKSFKILIIGDSCTDVYNYGVCERLSPEAPVPVLKIVYTEEKPGMSLNVENNLKAFKHETILITNSEKIIKERFVDQRSMQHLLRVDTGEGDKDIINSIDLGLLKAIKNINFDFDCVVISDYDKGFLTYESCYDAVSLLSKTKKPIFVDSKKKDLTCFKNCIIKINEKEFRSLKEIDESSEMIVTLGSSGAMWNKKMFIIKSINNMDIVKLTFLMKIALYSKCCTSALRTYSRFNFNLFTIR